MQYLKDNVKEKILAAATAEFVEHGFSNASVRNIALSAEVSLGNMYRYFSGKQELYIAVITPLINAFKESVRSALHSFHRHVEAVVDIIFEQRQMFQLLQKSLNDDTGFDLNKFTSETVGLYIDEIAPDSYLRKDYAFFTSVCAGFDRSFLVLINQNLTEEKLKANIKNLIYFYFRDINRTSMLLE